MTSTENKLADLIKLCSVSYGTMIEKPLEPITYSVLSTIARSIYQYVSLFDCRPEDFYSAHLLFLEGVTKSLRDRLTSVDAEEFLTAYTNVWSLFLLSNRRINATALHFNNVWRSKITPRPGVPVSEDANTLFDFTVLGEVTWRNHVFESLVNKLNSALMELITKDRDGLPIDADLIKNVLSSFVRLGINKSNIQEPTLEVYAKAFQTEFLERTRIYYALEARLFVERSSILEYAKHANARIKLEEARVQAYLHPETRQSLMELLGDLITPV